MYQKQYSISNIDLQQKEFEQFQKLIYDWAGIHMSEAKQALIAGRLLKRLRYYDLNSYQQYIDIVTEPSNKDEKQVMINLLTTNETYFFREEQHLFFLRDKFLPEYKKKPGETFRIWSAAASSGQEAYSIAMILYDHFGPTGWEIFGTDINEEVLEKARVALYPLDAAQKIPENYLKKYCLKGVRSNSGFFTVINELKKPLSFQKMNLNETFPQIGMFDIVFLRNVMIYFDIETKRKVVDRIYNVIKEDGCLILGHSENLNNISSVFKNIGPTIYRK